MNTIINIENHIAGMHDYFMEHETKETAYRINKLKLLERSINDHESDIFDALANDLGKSDFESYVTEVGIVLSEIRYQIKHLRRWAKPVRKCAPLSLFPSHFKIHKEPYGVVLVIAPWNYPFQLLINPLVGAISAGNCVVLKTSPQAPETAAIVEKIIKECFSDKQACVIHGNREINQLLLLQPFDYIFFTGSPSLGKIVMTAAAANLTPVTLELGGKSPCIIDKSADIAVAARRVAWGKTVNCGQTCIAPDYLLLHKDIKYTFIEAYKKSISEMYGEQPNESPDYPRIISSVAMKRLVDYLQVGNIIMGGEHNIDDNYLSPTLIDNLPEDAAILHEEIFGPIFPIIEFENTDEVIGYINHREKPLALYLFSKDKSQCKRVLHETTSGGACINDVLIHIANHRVPFGGVGHSGMGCYHGKYSFDTFTLLRSVAYSSAEKDIPIKYPPYSGKLDRYKSFL